MFSNKYIFIYSSIMVIIVAALLSTAAMVLKPFQERNMKAEKIQGVLASANIKSSRSDAALLFNKFVVEEFAIDKEGNVVMSYKNGKIDLKDKTITQDFKRPFELNIKEQLKIEKESAQGKTTKKAYFPLYIIEKDSKKYYIVPVYGKGLWGPIYGNLAFDSNFNTIAGATFGNDKETPGLGAEISEDWFGNEFIGKEIFDKNGDFTSITVVKGGVANSNINPLHGVDAISGSTITSNAVSVMLKNCLGNYVQYIEKSKKEK